MTDTIIVDSNCSWLKETSFVELEQGIESKKEAKKMALFLINSLKNKATTSSKLKLLKEKIDILNKEWYSDEEEKVILDIYNDISDNTDANFNLWLFFLVQNDIKKWADYLKKSLEKSKKYEESVASLIKNTLEQVKKWFNIRWSEEIVYFIKQFKEITKEITKNEISLSNIEEEKNRLQDFQKFLKTL